MDLWIDEFYGLTKTYEDIVKKNSKKQKPTDENPDPYWSPHLTKRNSKPKRYVSRLSTNMKCCTTGPKITLYNRQSQLLSQQVFRSE